ncbi:hypothetical protein GCM10023203_31600 [Actinomycetospora straminea]|uniref:Uncharacterized protein n=2 Tax=Actinomycetospora straminea TaxID=663607 RepID=A0ABP9EJG9_9PSEU
MATITFDTPAHLRDAPAGSPFYAAWHREIARLVNDRVPLSRPGRSVDPSVVDLEVDEERLKTWTGFSRPLLMEHRDDRPAAFAASEDRSVQIEYLEWHVTRTDGAITKITFTTETPEYYAVLAATEPQVLLDLYRRLVSPQVQLADLVGAGGTYKPRNKWNTTLGIVHYIMPINSMKDMLGVSEEIQNAADARDNFEPLPYQRMTGADARLSFDNWVMTRRGLSVAPWNPPGLYIVDWDDTGWTKPDGTPVDDYWTVARGAEGMVLRLEYEVPATEDFVVGDIAIGGRPITTGGEVAEHIVLSARTVAGRESP